MQSTRQTPSPATFSPSVVEFLQQPLPAHLATINPSGSPQLTVMWFKYEDGDLLFTTLTNRVKFRNQQHDPRGAVSIVDRDDMWKWVIVNGTFSVDGRDPQKFYRDLAAHYLQGEKLANWEKTAVFEGRTVLRLTPRRVRTLGFPQD